MAASSWPASTTSSNSSPGAGGGVSPRRLRPLGRGIPAFCDPNQFSRPSPLFSFPSVSLFPGGPRAARCPHVRPELRRPDRPHGRPWPDPAGRRRRHRPMAARHLRHRARRQGGGEDRPPSEGHDAAPEDRPDDAGRDQDRRCPGHKGLSVRLGAERRRVVAEHGQARHRSRLGEDGRRARRVLEDSFAVGHRRRPRPFQRLWRHPVPTQYRPGRRPRSRTGPGDRPGDRQGRARHRRQLGLCPDHRRRRERTLGPVL